ncbi:MAG: hypothetical protein MJ163_00245 [Alphaproteobacteria bacterium]|nr:hypothetical protein [Alphaproteobacteria bacterium]
MQGAVNITTPTTATLFAIHATGTTTLYHSRTKIYEYKMWRNGILTQHMIPVKRDSGMYDTVSKTFFTNAGTGTFTEGPVVQ